MAVLGIGTDIIALQRIEQSFTKHGIKFAERILSEAELLEFSEIKHPIPFLAKRFAAKEAISKALGTGMRNGIDFKQLSIGHDSLGKPECSFSGKALEWVTTKMIKQVSVSISDEKLFAVAFAVAEV